MTKPESTTRKRTTKGRSYIKDDDVNESIGESEEEENDSPTKKKDKKLVFLSRSVLKSVRKREQTTGTEIAYEILDLYKKFSDRVDFKNVQRRVYDALNVLSAMNIITKNKNTIQYNEENQFIDDSVLPNTAPDEKPVLKTPSPQKSRLGKRAPEIPDTARLEAQ